ncbi:MAG: hypothetical protein WBB74_09575 [Gaiellaceae bacterium]
MASDLTILFDEIGALIDAPINGDRAQALARIERTLTDGYAQALSLEAERLRLERRIGEVAVELTDRNKELKADELALLGRRLTTASDELARLRESLGGLRDRADEIREAA